MNDSQIIRSLVEQLDLLYKEKQTLHRALGVSDPQSLLLMIRSLESQLCSLYDEKRPSKNDQIDSENP